MFNILQNSILDIEYSGAIDNNLINKYEQILDVKFGSEYRTFLSKYGCLSVEYLEFYGICRNNKAVPSSIHVTQEIRKLKKNLPLNLVIFYELGNGVYFGVNENDNVYKIYLDDVVDIQQSFKSFVIEKIKQLGE